jgi:hypothetical protein
VAAGLGREATLSGRGAAAGVSDPCHAENGQPGTGCLCWLAPARVAARAMVRR